MPVITSFDCRRKKGEKKFSRSTGINELISGLEASRNSVVELKGREFSQKSHKEDFINGKKDKLRPL